MSTQPLSFTPSFTYKQLDAASTLQIVVDYSGFPDYTDFSSLAVNITTTNNLIDSDVTLTISSSLTGTITASTGDSALTGTATVFTDEISAGDWITFGDDTDKLYLVDSVTNDTTLILASPLVTDLAGSTAIVFYKAIFLQVDDLGLTAGGKFPDDIYTFLYTFTFIGTTDETGTYTDVQALSCTIGCMVDSLIAGIPAQVECNPCDPDYVDETMKAFLYYEALQGASYNGSIDHYNTIYSGLENILEQLGTSCS